ncbi:cdc42 effector protein 1 [Astyanax mexicanus]|uniref:cdc42 effector protein 1 n=1 Tax=Astyanax mexicanus TaxID=7994 RepID=UPI0020CAC3D0|nr:cdc42 effector protein 1 [Astyanax mexicanus]
MSLGKLPGIKGLVSTSHSRRRIKTELSTDMISMPLGDFRHTMHVGRGGDVFGDTSFLSEHGGKGSAQESPDSKPARFFSRTLRHVRRTPQPRLRVDCREFSSPPPPVSPIIKNAISLPQLNLANGSLEGALLPTSASCLEQPLYSYGVQSGFVTLPRLSRLDRNSTESSPPQSQQRRSSEPDPDPFSTLHRSDSLTSFTVDLGPSLMTELLGLIHSSSSHQVASQDLEDEEEEEEPSSLFEMAVESPCLSSRGRSSSPDWTQPDTEMAENEDSDKRLTPDASMWSPVRVEPTMEAERFQQAADILSRHYGGGGVVKERRKAPFAFPEEEEEIKV